MNNRVVKKESAGAAASSQRKNSESNSCAKDDDGVVNNHHDEVTINSNSFNDAIDVDIDDDGDELLRKVMAEAMETLDSLFSTTTNVLLPNTNTNTYVDVDVNVNDTAAAAPTTVALPVVNNIDTLSTTTTTTVADVMAKSYHDFYNNNNNTTNTTNGEDAVTTTNITGQDNTTATKADDVGNDEGKSNNGNNNNNNDRINEGVQKIKTEPRDSIWVLYNGNNNNIDSSSNNDDDDHKDKENSKGDGANINMPPTKKRKSRLLRELEDHLGLPGPSQSSSSDDDDDNDSDSDSDIQPPPPPTKKMKMLVKVVAEENSTDDSPTNRKRTRDHSDDDDSSDDTDDSNIDNDEEEEEEDPRKDNDAVCNHQKDIRRSRKNDEIWMGMFEKLVAYKNQHNNTMVPQKYKKDPKLGKWVNTQRNAYKNNEVLPDRIELLNSVEFKWVGGREGKYAVGNKKWMNIFQKLVVYQKQYKDTAVPVKYDKDPKFGMWVSNQRQSYKSDELDPSRVDLLNSIDFIWEVDNRYQMWMGMFEKLVEYKKEHKDTLVTHKYPKLGQWVSRQRKAYRNDKLLPKRLVLLNSIDFTWNVNKAAR